MYYEDTLLKSLNQLLKEIKHIQESSMKNYVILNYFTKGWQSMNVIRIIMPIKLSIKNKNNFFYLLLQPGVLQSNVLKSSLITFMYLHYLN